MKRYMTTLALLLGVIFLTASPAVQAEPGSAFDKLKALAGEWAGQSADGQSVKVSYQVMSNGSAVMETLRSGTEENMITIYHMDGNDLRMTHYCSAGNQPRMRATPVGPDAGVISFEFVDATNVKNPADGHMQSLKIAFQNNDHISQTWTWAEKGRSESTVFTLARVK